MLLGDLQPQVLSRPWVIAFQWCLVPASPSGVPAMSVLERKILNVMELLTAAMASMKAIAVSPVLQPDTATCPYSIFRLPSATHKLHMSCLGSAPCGPGLT